MTRAKSSEVNGRKWTATDRNCTLLCINNAPFLFSCVFLNGPSGLLGRTWGANHLPRLDPDDQDQVWGRGEGHQRARFRHIWVRVESNSADGFARFHSRHTFWFPLNHRPIRSLQKHLSYPSGRVAANVVLFDGGASLSGTQWSCP